MHPAFHCGVGAKWAHATNSESLLRSALDDSTVDAIEADVSAKPGSDWPKAYMLHPPAVESDLSAYRFLEEVMLSCTKKIVKLDFKTADIVTEVVDAILKLQLADTVPLVMNADVIACADSRPAINSSSFLAEFDRLQGSTIPPVVSLGWCPPSGDSISLSCDQLSEMAALARGRPATLAVRADIAIASADGLLQLLRDLPGCGVTLWAHERDPVCPEALRILIQRLEPSPVWLDVPEQFRHRCL